MIHIIQFGLGPIGQRLTRYLAEREGLSVMAAVDPDPKKAGRDIGTLAGIEETGISVSPDLESVSDAAAADVAVISTVSLLQKLEPQISEVAEYKLDIVSTCEELVHPWQTQPECAARIDRYCRKQGVSCLGTGVNPGFLMDYLPSVLTSVCRRVDQIKVERIQDATPRRKPFRDKIGVGLALDEFEGDQDTIRHVGLKESVYMIADAMNWALDEVQETLEPVLAETGIQKGEMKVQQGRMSGVQQIARGYFRGQELVTLTFKAAVSVDQSCDTISIEGEPDITSTIAGGVNGDIATSAIIVNAIRSVQKAEPGLKTMLDIPTTAYFNGI